MAVTQKILSQDSEDETVKGKQGAKGENEGALAACTHGPAYMYESRAVIPHIEKTTFEQILNISIMHMIIRELLAVSSEL